MSRKKKRRYKLLEAEPLAPQVPPRVQAAVTIIQWAFYCAMAGIIIAFLLVLSLFSHFRLGQQWWLSLWPASIKLMTASGLTQSELTHLALWASVENGLIYGLIGILLGGVHVAFRALRRRSS